MSPRLTTALAAAAVLGTLAAAAGAGAPTYPSAIAVIGGSDAVGYASDPKHPFQEARANSWATGTNPAVRSRRSA